MPWSLYAEGYCEPEREHEFAGKLAVLLADYGARTSQLSGQTVNGPVHVPAPEPPRAKQD